MALAILDGIVGRLSCTAFKVALMVSFVANCKLPSRRIVIDAVLAAPNDCVKSGNVVVAWGSFYASSDIRQVIYDYPHWWILAL